MTKEFENKYLDKKFLRSVVETNDFQNSYIVGNVCNKKYLYKYYNMDVASNVIRDGFITIRFQQPSQWSDKFETLFYNADYSNVTADKSTHPKLYACCFTLDNVCEAAWKVYAGKLGLAKNCVQFKLSKSMFRKALAKYASKNGFIVYEGKVDYCSKYEIVNLHHPSSKYTNNNLKRLHEQLFCDGQFEIDNYLSLLLLKREAFKYENEYRYLLVPTTGRMKSYIDVQIPIKNVIKRIQVEQSCSKENFNHFHNICYEMGLGQLIEDIDLYSLDENLKNIIIEK